MKRLPPQSTNFRKIYFNRAMMTELFAAVTNFWRCKLSVWVGRLASWVVGRPQGELNCFWLLWLTGFLVSIKTWDSHKRKWLASELVGQAARSGIPLSKSPYGIKPSHTSAAPPGCPRVRLCSQFFMPIKPRSWETVLPEQFHRLVLRASCPRKCSTSSKGCSN